MTASGNDHTSGDGTGPPQDRRLWIIVGILAVIAVVAVALLVSTLGEDDSDDLATTDSSSTVSSTTSSTSSTTTSSTSTTTTVATTTSETPETTTPPEAPPATVDPAQCTESGADPANPEPAARAVFEAWTRGDTACAQRLMTQDAYDELFSRSGTGARDEFQGCWDMTEGDPHTDCAFTYEGGATHYMMQFSPTDGWLVFDITQVAD